MGSKIIKEKTSEHLTFIDDGLNLSRLQDKKEEKKEKVEPEYRLRESRNVRNLKKSRMTGGHGMQGHSPVYE